MVTPDNTQREAPLLSGSQTVKSIRDTGYKGTDYALAELIDNSFQWGDANTVLLIIVQRRVQGKRRSAKRIDEIWVVDDGAGMTDEALNLALSFGGSGKYDDRSGIGRFGMGLPQASVSQCKRTDVWTWQKSQPENASHTYLDLNEVEETKQAALTVPWPTDPSSPDYVAMPEWVLEVFKTHAVPDTSFGQPLYSGTAIRWTNLDKLRWVRADAMFTHTENLLGRVYRKFLTSVARRRSIKVAIMDGDTLGGPDVFDEVRPNDPLYLHPVAETTLEYWEAEAGADDGAGGMLHITDEPPFAEHISSPRDFVIRRPDGQGTSTVHVRLSLAKSRARPGRNPGSGTRQGQHARDNSGISVMRADRELVLEKTLAQEATDRWWGVEIVFDPSLDEIFGVTNNKQDAPYLTQALRLAREYRLSKDQALEQGLFDEEHPIAELYDMAFQLVHIVNTMKDEAKNEQKAASNARRSQPAVTSVASGAKKTRSIVSPTPGEADFANTKPNPDKAAATIDEKLKQDDVPDDIRGAIIANYRRGITIQVIEQPVKHAPAFFWPDEALNLEILCLNNAHPAYKSLIEPLRVSDDAIEKMSEEDAKRLLAQSADAITWLLLAWARYENEHRMSPLLGKIKEIREGWGRRLAEYVEDQHFKASSLFEGEDESQDSEGEV
ncbi:ATP-binding protein [Amycolatopsis taiwanensis]|uniref:Histidine kinase n=1 Tax=Amycolatopsis taiwanensis TaxID=342230 RepID=A0A9W6R8W0_9PSEU|nr:ATP-binding protein [Amycolatopsis taiwanensis]GLY71341.1 histidine kinase [Amycolatopsis taiwanensis]